MVDRAARWKFSWQQSPLAACPQEVKDGVEDGTKVGGTRSAARSRRRQNWRNPGPRRVGQVGVVESRVHRTLPLARVSALSRQTSTFQTPSEMNLVLHVLAVSVLRLFALYVRGIGATFSPASETESIPVMESS